VLDYSVVGETEATRESIYVSRVFARDTLEYILAVQWHPTYCETENYAGVKCQSQVQDSFVATHFSLHGLWPDNLDDRDMFPCYCDVSGPVDCRESRDPKISVDISKPVLGNLAKVMPGVVSGLHVHEWLKHGTCYEDDKEGADFNATPDEYYTESMILLSRLNDSGVRDLFVENAGGYLYDEQISKAFDEAFGPGAGKRVLIICSRIGNETFIRELWIGLRGDISLTANFSDLIAAAPTSDTYSPRSGCAGGRVGK
jgi:ribonuclease T2